jgi:polyhydroxyalkanoate synthesis regulator phasin
VDVKQQLIEQAMRLMQDPRVMKALQNPKVMQGLMNAFQLKAQIQQNLETNIQRLAKGLNLATAAEVRELRRTIDRLERELDGQRNGKPAEPPV